MLARSIRRMMIHDRQINPQTTAEEIASTIIQSPITNIPPWYVRGLQVTSPDVKISSFYFPDADVGLSPAQDLSIRLFNRYPEHRLGANGVAEIKAHPFFTDVDWRKILKREYEPVFKPKEAPMVFDTHPQDLGFASMSKEEAQELSDKAIAQWHAQSGLLDSLGT